jgi:xanthine dehydrogenase accessory factor
MLWSEFLSDHNSNIESNYYVIMTHRHDFDQDILETLLNFEKKKYIGLIGSRSKWERFKQRLTLKGVPLGKLEQVHCPIGLPIGGKSPQEVAISTAAQLLKIHHS